MANAARGSLSRGWPTDPGLSRYFFEGSRRSAAKPAPGWARRFRTSSSVSREEKPPCKCVCPKKVTAAGAVNQHYAIGLQRAAGKFLEEFEVLFAQLFARPVRCRPRHGIEIIRAHQTCGGFVVVAADGEDVERPNPVGD